jgi:hypothetical protein
LKLYVRVLLDPVNPMRPSCNQIDGIELRKTSAWSVKNCTEIREEVLTERDKTVKMRLRLLAAVNAPRYAALFQARGVWPQTTESSRKSL